MTNQPTLELFIYLDGVNDIPFFSGGYEDFILTNGDLFTTSDNKTFSIRALNEDIVIHAFTYNAKRMGAAPTITTTIKYSECLDELFSEKVYAIFDKERYFLIATPSSSYSNEEIMYKHEATFVSERIALENTYFYDVVPENESFDKPVSNNSNFVISGDIKEFAKRLQWSLDYSGLDYTVIVDGDISSEYKFLSVENKFFSEVLQEAYNTYDIPYYFVGKEIHIGFTDNAISEVFRYGDSDALMSITKSHDNNRTINRVTGFGSEENIPYYYPNNSPEGDIQVQLAETNTGITDTNDIKVIDYEKFAKKVGMNQIIELFPTRQSVNMPFEFYGYFQDRKDYFTTTKQNVTRNTVITTSKGLDTKYQISFNISNLDDYSGGYWSLDADDEFGDYDPELWLPHGLVWKGLGDIRPAGLVPYVQVISCENDANNLSKIYIGKPRVYWILNKYCTDRNGWWFETIKKEELKFNEEHQYYEFPNFNEALDFDREDWWGDDMGGAEIKFEWDVIAPIDKYTLNIGFDFYNLSATTWKNSNGDSIELADIGLRLNKKAEIGDKFQKVLGDNGIITHQKHLMPPIYRESLGVERFYNAINNTHLIPDENENYTEDYYEFVNEYNGHNPKEQIVQFDEIKPTIKGATNSEKLRIDMFTEFAYDLNDNNEKYENENGSLEYKHPVFYGKLRKLGFNLFDHALDDGEMEIHMTSGNCSACVFKIAVDKDDHRTNLVQVDENGNLKRYEDKDDERYGNVISGWQDDGITPQPEQQDTINNEVWIALYKDEDTFGELYPVGDIKPKGAKNEDGTYNNEGDTFVITHINMPQEYIENAEKQLYQQLIYYMFDNNTENFKYSIKFSRIYFAEHPEILEQLNENARITVEYDGIEKTLYVSSLTYKTTENEVLPEIIVELADELSVSQNAVQKAANSVKSELYQAMYGIDVVAQGSRVFLRKDQPDTVNAPITFNAKPILNEGATLDKQMNSKDYFEGAKGLGIRKDKNNNWHIEADYLHARKKFSAKEVEIQKMYHIGGAQIKSSASLICSRVVEYEDSYRCYFEAKDEEGNMISNQFIVGDQAYVQTFNLIDDGNGNTTNHFYWRLVEAVDANSITLSKTNCIEGSTAPLVGDHIVQLGYQGEDRPERQVAVIDAGAGEGAPYYRQFVGINSFEWPDAETQLKPNDNVLTGRVTIKDGSLLAGTIAVNDDHEHPVALINGSNSLGNSKKIVIAAGINDYSQSPSGEFSWVDANTIIYDDGTINVGGKVGMSAIEQSGKKQVRIWAGETETNKANAPFQVLQDGKVIASNAEIKGKIEATEGELNNVLVKGSIRCPFSLAGLQDSPVSAQVPTNTDNIFSDPTAIPGLHHPLELSWDMSQSGRRITLAGNYEIEAPPGMYFLENGSKKSVLKFQSEIVQLLGYSEVEEVYNPSSGWIEYVNVFIGWIILNRQNFRVQYPYGRIPTALAMGRVNADGSATIKTFDGSELTVQHTQTGHYSIDIPSTWMESVNNCLVMSSIFYENNSIGAVSIVTIRDTVNRKIIFRTFTAGGGIVDGNFEFMIYPLKSWD